MDMEVTLLGLKPYNFVNDNGENIVGATAWYYTNDKQTDGSLGHIPAKASISQDEMNAMKSWTFPMKANAVVSINLSNARNPLKVTGFKKIGAVAI